MKNWGLVFLLFSLPLVADPFHRDNRTELPRTELNTFDEEEPNKTNCHHSLNIVWSETALADLKLVGVLQIEEQVQALFTNGEQVLFLQEGDFLSEDAAKIEQISKQKVKLAVTQADCATNQFIYLRF